MPAVNEGRAAAGPAAELLLRLDPATRALVEAAAGTMRLSPASWLDLRVLHGSPEPLPVEADLPPEPFAGAQPVRAVRGPLRPPPGRGVGAVLDGLRARTGETAGRVRVAAIRFAPRVAQVRRTIAAHPLVHHRVLGQRTVLAGAAVVALVIAFGIWVMQPAGTDDAAGTTVRLSTPPGTAAGNANAPARQPGTLQATTPGPAAAGGVPDSAAALAAATFRERAEKGDATAQHDLGVLYADGRGVARDYLAAARWFRRAAASGMANAQFNLAVLTERGLGVAADMAEAARLYRAAAEQGHAGAQYNLGIVLAEGRGVAQDYTEAAAWFRRAADQGFAKAAYNLGVLHERGLTGAVDDVDAYRWYALALEAGDGDAKERMEQIARRLPPQDLNQARARPTGSVDPGLVADIQRLLAARG